MVTCAKECLPTIVHDQLWLNPPAVIRFHLIDENFSLMTGTTPSVCYTLLYIFQMHFIYSSTLWTVHANGYLDHNEIQTCVLLKPL